MLVACCLLNCTSGAPPYLARLIVTLPRNLYASSSTIRAVSFLPTADRQFEHIDESSLPCRSASRRRP